jgi:hypothetical protein
MNWYVPYLSEFQEFTGVWKAKTLHKNTSHGIIFYMYVYGKVLTGGALYGSNKTGYDYSS